MKAMACRVCGTRIPESSIRCPYCYRFQWRGIGMIAVVAVVFLSAAAGGAWLMTGPRQTEIQPEAVTPFESGPVEPVAEPRHPDPTVVYQESETPYPEFQPVEEKQADRLPPIESPSVQSAPPARQEKSAAEASPPTTKPGDSPSNAALEKKADGETQKDAKRAEDAAEAYEPQGLPGVEPAPALPEQAPARAARMPVTNDLAGSGLEAEEPATNENEGLETETEPIQP